MEIDNRAKKARKVIIDEDGKRKYFYGPQKFRKQWRTIPELRDWLRPSKRSNTEAFCIYCERNLKANRGSLINHAGTKFHLDAIEARKKLGLPTGSGGRPRKSKTNQVEQIIPDDDDGAMYDDEDPVGYEEGEIYDGSMPGSSAIKSEDEYGDESQNFMMTECDPPEIYGDEDENGAEPGEVVDGELTGFSVPAHIANGSTSFNSSPLNNTKSYKPIKTKKKMANNKPPITTHVLDTMHGCPAIGIPVSLFRLQDEEWTLLETDITNDDGRCTKLIVPQYFFAGRYKLHFFIEEYFKKLNVDFFYPFIEVIFDVKDATEHYHVPILLNAFGYTTYRGS